VTSIGDRDCRPTGYVGRPATTAEDLLLYQDEHPTEPPPGPQSAGSAPQRQPAAPLPELEAEVLEIRAEQNRRPAPSWALVCCACDTSAGLTGAMRVCAASLLAGTWA
jgi:hypothetical protein